MKSILSQVNGQEEWLPLSSYNDGFAAQVVFYWDFYARGQADPDGFRFIVREIETEAQAAQRAEAQ